MPNTCPKCQLPVQDDVTTCPSCGSAIAVKKKVADDVPSLNWAQRLAGAFLLINGIFLLIEEIYLSSAPAQSREYTSILVSLLFGVMLLAGVHKILLWVKISVILGAVFYGGQAVMEGDNVMLAFQLALSAGLLLLLFGRPHWIKATLAILLVSFYFSLEVSGLSQEFIGKNPMTPFLVRMQNNLEPIPEPQIQGVELPYSFQINQAQWEELNRQDAKQEKPIVDRWFIAPKYDAHLFTITEILGPDEYIPLKALVDAVISNGEDGSDSFTVHDRHALETDPKTGYWMDATAVIDGEAYHFHYGIFSIANTAVQVVCYSFDESFEHIKADCDQAIKSFAMPAAPDAVFMQPQAASL